MEFNRESFFEGEILLINKPLNWTSFQVVNKIRWLIKSRFNIKKIKVCVAKLNPPTDSDAKSVSVSLTRKSK